MLKSYKMVRCRNIFENLIYEMRDMWNTDSIDHEERQLIGSALRYLHFMVKGFYFCNNLLLVTFMYAPFWEMVKRYAGHENEKYLHFFYWLPFDPLQSGYYEVVLAVQTWQSLVTIWANMSGDLLFVIFLSHITLQFDLLSVRIKKLIYVPHDDQLLKTYPLGQDSATYLEKHRLAIETFTEKDWEDYYAKEIAEIVLRHRALIRLSGDVENMYKFALLVNFINSSIVLCFCGFCSIVVEKWNEFGYKSFLVTALSQMWIMCWYGQQLADSTERVSRAVYNSGWYKAPKKIKRSLLIMLFRSQKTLYVSTCGFSNITMASYSKVRIKSFKSFFWGRCLIDVDVPLSG
uniref:Odorant receptor n=1 Tax=Dendrolimus houi TaxID=765132 RepID=A0A076E7J5_9NEOP|nr:odorant receptor [Dendrolimus houi]